MERSKRRILTTHTGSLPRPGKLLAMLYAREKGEVVDEPRFDAELRRAVADTVRRQLAAGVDVISDGEMGKPGYSTYVVERLSGFSGQGRLPAPADLADFPAYGDRVFGDPALRALATPSCTGEIRYQGAAALERDLTVFRSALEALPASDAFVTAASPGVIALFLQNEHYPSHERYLEALGEAMRVEYEAIHRAGFLLQVDCPDLAMGRHMQFSGATLEEFRRTAALHVEVLNHALSNIPPESLRMHLCWGNYEGPHHHDVALGDIIDIVLRARPSAISFEAANPRHEHEWRLWETTRLPEGKLLMPGVVDSTSNFIEHPELVAERIERFAKLVGAANVIAGTDCGFSTFAGMTIVDPAIAWAKLEALAQGARLASRQLYRPRVVEDIGGRAR